MDSKQTTYRETNPNVELILCILFGWVGAHRFYTKKYKSATLYLLTLGLFTIGWVYDAVRMIVARIDARKGKTTPKYVSAIVTALIVLVMFIAIPTGNSGKTPERLDRQSETVDTTDSTETDPTETLALQPSETASDATEPSAEAVASPSARSEATEPTEETQPEQKQQTPTQLETAPETQPATEKTPEPVIEPAVEPATTPPAEPPATATNSSGTMVWITTGGGKYHSDPNCSNMKNPYQITLEEAIAMGREPCKNCYHE